MRVAAFLCAVAVTASLHAEPRYRWISIAYTDVHAARQEAAKHQGFMVPAANLSVVFVRADYNEREHSRTLSVTVPTVDAAAREFAAHPNALGIVKAPDGAFVVFWSR